MTGTTTRATMPPSPEVERELAFDMVRRSVWVGPAVVVLATLVWGADGAASAGLAIVVVLVNLLLSAVALSRAAAHSPTALMAAALGGFLVRMGLVTLVVLLVRDQTWIDLVAFGVAVLVTHLGLLFWELRFVSASLAYPGLKPGAAKEARTS